MEFVKKTKKVKYLLALIFMFAILVIPNQAHAANNLDMVNLTVPTNISVNQTDQGEITTSDFNVKNNSLHDYKISDITAESLNGWEFVESKDALKMNTKKMHMLFSSVTLKNGTTNTNILVNHNSEKNMNLAADIGAFTSDITEDAFTLNIKFKVNPRTYNIIFDEKGGSLVEDTTSKNGDTLVLPKSKKDGYIFRGWKSSEDGAIYNDSYIIPAMPKGENITMTAVFAKVVKVSFDSNTGDTTHDPITVYLDQERKVDLPAPKKAGYLFKDWTCDLDGKQYVNSFTVPENTEVNEIKMTANWTRNISVSFDTAGGNESYKDVVIDLDSLNRTVTLNTPTKSKHTFLGWECSLDNKLYTGSFEVPSDVDAGSIKMTAKWFKNVTVKFNLAGGSGSFNNVLVDSPSKKTIELNAPTKVGFKFKGWKSSEDERIYQTSYTVPDSAKGDEIILEAQWVKVVKVQFNGNGSIETFETKEVILDENRVVTLETPTKSGYTFGGWECSKDSKLYKGSYEVPASASEDEITMKAMWSRNVNVTFNGNGSVESYEPISVTSYTDRIITLPLNKPTKVGYAFIGWTSSLDGKTYNGTYEVPKDSSSSAVTMTAKWSRNVTVSFNSLGYGTFDDVVVTSPISRTVTLPTPSRSGYTFNGWDCSLDGSRYNGTYTVPQDAASSTITMTASWSLNYYRVCTVQYEPNGANETYSNEYIYNTDSRYITLPTPTKDGYTFLGWSTNSASDEGKKFQGGESYYVYSYPDPLVFTANWGKYFRIHRHFNFSEARSMSSPAYSGEVFDFNDIPAEYQSLYGSARVTGWWCEELNRYYNVNEPLPETSYSEMNFHAHWNKTVTIKYNSPGWNKTGSCQSGTETILPNVPERPGYTFRGWKEEGSSFIRHAGSKMRVMLPPGGGDAPLNLNAVWDTNPRISVNLDWNSSAANSSTTYPSGSKITLPSSKNGHTIKYWRGEGSNAKIADGGATFTVPSSPITLYAVYNTKMTYKWNFDNGVSPATDKYDAGYRFTPRRPTKKGYTLTGWKVQELGVIWDPNITWRNKLQSSTTLTCTAVWKKN